LEKVVGALVQGPSKPERSVWHRPSVWAPDRATMPLVRAGRGREREREEAQME